MSSVIAFLDEWENWIRVADVLTIVVSLVGIPAIFIRLYWNTREYDIIVECVDGPMKGKRLHIDTIKTPDLKRGEVLGIVAARKTRTEEMDFSMFRMKDAVKGRTVTFPLNQADFAKWDDDEQEV